ncbi:hypothetical protein ACL02T_33135 [Pseudonocardia sp. RS010]|uniref:hypothetical protein n=1 Tax=Pseudonocardia sp. RS010 TaxID=3385979 RepID=UPI0039A023DE
MVTEHAPTGSFPAVAPVDEAVDQAIAESEAAGWFDPATAEELAHAEEQAQLAIAGDVAAGLEALAVLVREHPQLAELLRLQVDNLSVPILDDERRAAVLAAAEDLGASVAPARFTGPGFDSCVISFGVGGTVRLVVSTVAPTERPATPAVPFVPELETSL